MTENTYTISNQTLADKITAVLRAHPVIIQLLRFAAIGSLNTALDFIVLNLITKYFNVSFGLSLGQLNVIGFSLAVVQSYLWNRAWTFSAGSSVGLLQNALRLVLVGGLGFSTFLAVVIGANYEASSLYFCYILIAFVVVEVLLWRALGLSFGSKEAKTQFVTFLIISLIGLAINSAIVVLATKIIGPGLGSVLNEDSVKNIAKIVATAFTLVWNFIGYKLVVFRK